MNQEDLDKSYIDVCYENLMRDGVCVIKSSFDPKLIKSTLAGVKRFIENNPAVFEEYQDSDGHYPRIINLHSAYNPLMKLFAHNKIALGVQDRFFGGEASSIHTSLYFEKGTQQDIHRDTPYFCTKPELMYLGVWVALEDANEKNGCLQVIKGGHLLDELDRDKIGLEVFGDPDKISANSEQLWMTYQDMVLKQALSEGLKVEKIAVKAGDTVIWHPQLPHGGSAILDIKRTRHSIVFHVTPRGVPVYFQDVFFNSKKEVPSTSKAEYGEFEGRSYTIYDSINVGHIKSYKVYDLQQSNDEQQRPKMKISKLLSGIFNR
jgi:phytanoyl-CoA hydroxylase